MILSIVNGLIFLMKLLFLQPVLIVLEELAVW